MSLQEAVDIRKQIGKLQEEGMKARSLGVEVDSKTLFTGGAELLQAAEGQTLEKQRILFPNLYRQDLEGLEDGEVNSSPVPSEADLDILSGDWLKKVSWTQNTEITEDDIERSDADDENEEEEQENSQYFDAKTVSVTPPLASSAKKAPKEKKKVKRRKSTSSEDSLLTSVSQQSLATSCNPAQLKKKAEKRIVKIRKALQDSDLSEESLKTL